MAPIEFPRAGKVSGKDRLLLGLMIGVSSFALLTNLARAVRLDLSFSAAALVALAVILVVMLLPASNRVTTLYPEEKALVIASTAFRLWPRSHRIDLSECAWVRAKGNRGKAIRWVQVEVGTLRYKIIGLMIVRGSGTEEINTALAWCGRISEALLIENKGYREAW